MIVHIHICITFERPSRHALHFCTWHVSEPKKKRSVIKKKNAISSRRTEAIKKKEKKKKLIN